MAEIIQYDWFKIVTWLLLSRQCVLCYAKFCLFLNWAILGLFFFIFVFNTVDGKWNLPITKAPGITGVTSDRSTNWATPLPLLLNFVYDIGFRVRKNDKNIKCGFTLFIRGSISKICINPVWTFFAIQKGGSFFI